MAILDRVKLRQIFSEGAIPSQEDFENLIDSMIHKLDSGSISQEDGLRLSPQGSDKRMISFFENISNFKPTWTLEQYPRNSSDFGLNLVDQNGESKFFIQKDGNIGIGTKTPTTKLDVDGNISMIGRRGTYASGNIPGDTQWYNITPKLNACHAFEVIAKIGKPGKGLYSMIYAIALSTFGRSKNEISKTCAFYGSFTNKIDLRWHGETFNYYLHMRTKRNYGKDTMIKYNITNLWWDD
jgi:hypothetical protein